MANTQTLWARSPSLLVPDREIVIVDDSNKLVKKRLVHLYDYDHSGQGVYVRVPQRREQQHYAWGIDVTADTNLQQKLNPEDQLSTQVSFTVVIHKMNRIRTIKRATRFPPHLFVHVCWFHHVCNLHLIVCVFTAPSILRLHE